MDSAEPEASEQAPSLVDVLQQLEVLAVERLMDKLLYYPWNCAALRLTCQALRELVDGSVRVQRRLPVRLREDGTTTQPLAALGRWGRRDGITLKLELPAAGPAAGVDALLPAAFAELPEQARRRVAELSVSRSRSLIKFAPAAAVSGAEVGAALPCLRRLDLSSLRASWTAGGAGEAYTALAALGTLDELELPGVPCLTGVEALAGSLRSLSLWDHGSLNTLTLAAAAPLIQRTRLRVLELNVWVVDLGEGSYLQALLRLLPLSVRTLRLALRAGERGQVDSTFTVSSGCLVTAELGRLRTSALRGLARDELLPCLGPGGRLQSLSVQILSADGWGDTDMAPALEPWRRSDRARVGTLELGTRQAAADLYGALAALDTADVIWLTFDSEIRPTTLRLPCHASPQPGREASWELPPPEGVLRMTLHRITGRGQQGGAAGVDHADSQKLLLRGPAAAAALEQPSSEAAVKAWAQDLERRARAGAGDALADGGPLIEHALPLPPACAVLLQCSMVEGAAEAVAAAAAAAAGGDESAAARVLEPWHTSKDLRLMLERAVQEVMSELWTASAGEEGPSLQQRLEWAVGVRDLVDSLPLSVCLRD